MFVITHYNYVQFAIKNYNNPLCKSVEEFNNDLKRVSYIKKHLKKYLKSGKIKDRLLLNQIIIFCNVFGINSGVRMLFFRCEEILFPALKTFLVYLNFIPKTGLIPELNFSIHSISLDANIVKLLRNYDTKELAVNLL